MAINPETAFPGKIKPSSAAFPFGEAQDITTPGDGTGTPWVALILNDLFGFQQAMLDLSSIVPSGSPDQVGASQYLEAFQKTFANTRVDLTALVNDSTVKVGQSILLLERTAGKGGSGIWEVVLTSSVTPDTFGIVISIADALLSFVLKGIADTLSPKQFGAIGDGVADDTGAWDAWEADTRSKMVTRGDYLVSGIVKRYDTPTFVNTVDNNHAAGHLALESVTVGQSNTAFGKSALRKTDGASPLGSDNTAVGNGALENNTEGYRNVAVGHLALNTQVGTLTTGNSNTAVGYESMFTNNLGKDNTAVGYLSMFFNTEGGGNVALGYRALFNNIGVADTTGSFNVSLGYETLLANTFGNSNTATGWRAMFSNTTGTRNTANGQETLRTNITGQRNVAVGYQALHDSDSDDNVAVGYQALTDNTAGTNTAVGKDALLVNTSGVGNTAVGFQALDANLTTNFCTAIGRQALSASTGNNNTALGYQSGISITTAISCTALGFTALLGNATFSNCTGVGNNSAVTAANQVQLGDSATTTFAFGAVQDRSDERDKLDISDLTDAHIAFFMDVEWKQYRFNYRENYRELVQNENGESELIQLENDGSKAGVRFHIGAVAQQVEAAMKKHNIDFAGLQHHAVGGGEDVYSIGYQEFIGIQGLIIQRQQARLDSIEDRLAKAGF